ncbi:hypothetical protein [Gemmatimonas sp.]|jgi:hypothetical protein|uniref:hypothetical protein n=1 Tax=Gemmatimonas sp. TaxID=1962908 RepID=UPI0037C15514
MPLLTVLASASLLAATASDSVPRAVPSGPFVAPVALAVPFRAPVDTTKRARKAVTYSDGYYKRLAIHKTLSWAMLPLFAASYLSGDQLLDKGDDAPDWAQSVHPIAATGSAVLFGANAFTGGWSLWEGRKDPNGRTRRLLHSALFMVATGGFAYAGSIADQAEENGVMRERHRNVAVASMSASTVSWLIMLIGN